MKAFRGCSKNGSSRGNEALITVKGREFQDNFNLVTSAATRKMGFFRRTLSCSLTALISIAALAEEPMAQAVFLEPVGRVDANRAEIHEVMPLYRLATNQEKYAVWM